MDRGRVGEDRGSKETDGCPLTSAGSVRGEKSAFITHILSCGKLCIHVSAKAISAATALKSGSTLATQATSTASAAKKHARSASTADSQSQPKKPNR
jgi:hypothetical protein